MALFLVNRYLGEEDNRSVEKESRAQALLAKLQQKAKEKQQQQQQTQRPSKERTQEAKTKKRQAEEDSSQEPKLHKKRRSAVESGSQEEPGLEGKKNKTAGIEKQKKKKDRSGSSVKGQSENTPGTGRDGQVDTGGEEETTGTENVSGKTSAPTGYTVDRVLPQWLAQPDVIHRDIKSNLVPISAIPELSPLLVKKLQNNGIQHLFPGGMRRSLADIVVATPGRLVDHINKNSGFSLEHLRFLIIDEADRMIDSMHQSWLSQVVKAVYRSGSGGEAMSIFRRTEPAFITAASLSPPQMPLQKLLFSATLTQNPEKLQQLGLHQPRLFSSIHSHSNTSSTPAAPTQTRGGFNFPQGLTEYYVPCTLSKKPLLILHFILRMKLSPILCFTNSRETAHRLYLLVQLFGDIQAAEFSSRLSPAERKKTLKEFEQGKIQLLISTDAASRGIDVNEVKCVVNYDAPQYIRTYIHRSNTYKYLQLDMDERVEKNFLQMVGEAGSPGIQKQIVKPETLKGMEARYEQTLQELASVIKDEKAK
ncbi:hypothetical protein FQN60_015960 [Etheostoma spectabile]|uniref:ATP-dependent RNA helicase n=1 Tax=Etheostoma spectabile TaxID=54343 RepID=A0A5J5CPM0_9PERO|nr:hypothetical protein FQN60_015960 [Etheostoma spectabile]